METRLFRRIRNVTDDAMGIEFRKREHNWEMSQIMMRWGSNFGNENTTGKISPVRSIYLPISGDGPGNTLFSTHGDLEA